MQVRDTDQAKQLKTVVWKDQHGRPWDLTLDKNTLTHTTPPIPRFRAPLVPPLEYVKTDEDKIGRVRIDYRAWEAEWSAAEDRFYERTRELGRVVKDDADLRAIAGVMPQSPEFVRAARAGNRWVLGLPHPTPGTRYAVPAWAGPILDRIGPRTVRLDDLKAERQRERAKYADREETVEEMEPEILPPLATADDGFGEDDDDDDLDGLDAPADFGDDDEALEAPEDDEPDDLDDNEPVAPTGAARAAVVTPKRRGARRKGRG